MLQNKMTLLDDGELNMESLVEADMGEKIGLALLKPIFYNKS